ncbi:MAG TPA: preprotein translocase subunit YajC [Intrasporangium sp.]|uniref:preprotein translocase subunit YajC n=1 Tax=Intrasporangium sp. TaxID=1925024 RepID=UPI002D7661D6|nr:preprotein translocase subunit YajC [Intrasporangium sp.]HET7398210.1 preprotein translocase subunit YajC [Intrasporangium sp.]
MRTIADLAPTAETTGGGASSLLFLALPLLLLAWMFWSANRRQKQMRAFTSSISVGDAVITSSGLYGVVRRLDDESAWLEVAEGTTLRFDRRALAMKQPDDSAGATATPGAEATGTEQ